jgi:hypothetical protein
MATFDSETATMPPTEDAALPPGRDDEALREIERFLAALAGSPAVTTPPTLSPSGDSTWVQQAEPVRLDSKY